MLFGKKVFFIQVRWLAVWISYLAEKQLKVKIIKVYLASL